MVEYSEFNERNTHTLRSIIKYLLNTCYKSNPILCVEDRSRSVSQQHSCRTEAGWGKELFTGLFVRE